MALMVSPVKPSVPVVLGGLPPPEDVGPFVIFVGAFNCFWFAGLFGF
jgi:hypothetical protein